MYYSCSITSYLERFQIKQQVCQRGFKMPPPTQITYTSENVILDILLPMGTQQCASLWDKSTYSENSPQIQAAAYNTSQMPIRCMLPVNRWALSSRVAIWATAKLRMALTRIATSSIWEAMRWPCRVPSNRVSSTRILMYLSGRYEEVQLGSESGKWHQSLKWWSEV